MVDWLFGLMMKVSEFATSLFMDKGEIKFGLIQMFILLGVMIVAMLIAIAISDRVSNFTKLLLSYFTHDRQR